ncbi:MAG: hypothetical protein ABSB87_09450 [Terriglobales bacterium]
MKLKTVAIVTLVVFGCSFASAQTFSFFIAGGYEVCDYVVITYNSGGVVAGYDDLTTLCGYDFNSSIVGFDATTGNDGQPAHGKGIVIGDAIYDASADAYTGEQFTIWLSGKASKMKDGGFTGPYAWMGVAGTYTGLYFGDVYGFLIAGPPAKDDVAGHATIAGRLPGKLRK